jgi:CrcB protein
MWNDHFSGDACRRGGRGCPLYASVGTGFLGGYTTYSALAVETDTLLRGDHVTVGLAYAAGSVVAGLVAAYAGVAAARAVVR